jgi:hypothetical protein
MQLLEELRGQMGMWGAPPSVCQLTFVLKACVHAQNPGTELNGTTDWAGQGPRGEKLESALPMGKGAWGIDSLSGGSSQGPAGLLTWSMQ